jgi:hypothetical protein
MPDKKIGPELNRGSLGKIWNHASRWVISTNEEAYESEAMRSWMAQKFPYPATFEQPPPSKNHHSA